MEGPACSYIQYCQHNRQHGEWQRSEQRAGESTEQRGASGVRRSPSYFLPFSLSPNLSAHDVS